MSFFLSIGITSFLLLLEVNPHGAKIHHGKDFIKNSSLSEFFIILKLHMQIFSFRIFHNFKFHIQNFYNFKYQKPSLPSLSCEGLIRLTKCP